MRSLPGLSGLATRYRLTNRRLMTCKGMKPVPDKEVPLDRIKDVKLVTDANSEFFVAGTLEVIDANGQTVLSLPGVPEPESVRHAILQAAAAWGPVLAAQQGLTAERQGTLQKTKFFSVPLRHLRLIASSLRQFLERLAE